MQSDPKENAYVVAKYFDSQRSIVTAQRVFRQQFGKQKASSRKVIFRAVTNFRETGNARKRKSPDRPRTSRGTAMKHRILECFHRDFHRDHLKDVIFKF